MQRFKYYNTTIIIHYYLDKILQWYNMENTTVTSLRISEEVWKEAKKCSLEHDLTLRKFVESAIIHELQRIKR